MRLDRRRLLTLAAALPALGLTDAEAFAQGPAPLPEGQAARHDFDYFIGSWRVAHRRLRQRLAGSNDWQTFEGRTTCQSLFGGLVNLNESVTVRDGRTSYGMGLRALDERGGRWADWYLTESDLSKIDPPLYGRFANGIGTFLANDMFEGRPILVRGRFSSVSPSEARWEQAFSTDRGASWETNWIMRYLRIA